MTKQFTLWVVSPPDMIWSHVFDEVAVGLQSAFADLGYDVRIVTNPKEIRGTAIVLGAHLAKAHGITLPQDCVIYNLEQVHPQAERFTPEEGYLDAMKTRPVWDYSETNIAALAKMGVENVVHCAIGYAPELTRIYRTKEDIDHVVFYATSNRRHLMPRDMIDNERSTAIQPGEAVEEKISLSDRFGLWLGFHSCNQDMYLAIVRAYATHFHLTYSPEALEREALEWSATRGARSGRVAWQFIQDLAGKMGKRIG